MGSEDDSAATETDGVGGIGVETPLQIDSQVDSQEKQWWQKLLVTAASFPLATNWSFPEGESPVSEALVAGAGLVGALIMLKDAIKESVRRSVDPTPEVTSSVETQIQEFYGIMSS